MVKLIAIRQTNGEYGQIAPGETFEANEDIARELEKLGVAKRSGDAPAPSPPQTVSPVTAPGVLAEKAAAAHANKAVFPPSNKEASSSAQPAQQRQSEALGVPPPTRSSRI